MLQENYRGISILNSSGGVTCTVQIVDKKTKMIIYPRHNSESGFTHMVCNTLYEGFGNKLWSVSEDICYHNKLLPGTLL
jgi:hypothetical protein